MAIFNPVSDSALLRWFISNTSGSGFVWHSPGTCKKDKPIYFKHTIYYSGLKMWRLHQQCIFLMAWRISIRAGPLFVFWAGCRISSVGDRLASLPGKVVTVHWLLSDFICFKCSLHRSTRTSRLERWERSIWKACEMCRTASFSNLFVLAAMTMLF